MIEQTPQPGATQMQGRPSLSPEELALQLSVVVNRLQTEVQRRESLRSRIEERWLEDLEQYYGQYDAATLSRLEREGKSKLFVNLTRPKGETVSAKLFDLLFPMDERNWGIEPTPNPTLTQQAQQLADQLAEMVEQAAAAPPPGEEMGPDGQPMPQEPAPEPDPAIAEIQRVKGQIEAIMAEAKRRCTAMEEVMDDQLVQCDWAAACRDVIEDGTTLGTGIVKGPIITGHSKRRWHHEQGLGAYSLLADPNPQPVFTRVDPFNLFPDPDAVDLKDSESTYELHPMTKRQLRALAERPGFRREAISRTLRTQPTGTSNVHTQLRARVGDHNDYSISRYKVWEYHGPLEADELRILIMATAEAEGTDPEEALAAFGDVDDPLQETLVTIWFSAHELFYIGPYPLDRGDPLYSAWCYVADRSSVWGYGVPWVMRHLQKAINSAWRQMMDNAGISSGSQVLIDPSKVEPADGSDDYSLRPWKTWFRKSSVMAGDRPFETFDVPNHQQAMAQIIEIARGLIEAETGVTQLMAGEQGPQHTKTLGGMSILLNASNVLFRRAVKNWDDHLTMPSIQRLYDWNMQFNDREDIKGDYEIKAKGVSVLLMREIESANLMTMSMHATVHPALGPITKVPPLYRRLVKSMTIPPDEVVMTDQEIDAEAAKRAAKPQQPEPEVLRAQVALEVAEIEAQTRIQVAQLNHETAMMRLAEDRNMSEEKLRAMLEQTRMKADSDERKMAAEAALTARIGPSGGGHF